MKETKNYYELSNDYIYVNYPGSKEDFILFSITEENSIIEVKGVLSKILYTSLMLSFSIEESLTFFQIVDEETISLTQRLVQELADMKIVNTAPAAPKLSTDETVKIMLETKNQQPLFNIVDNILELDEVVEVFAMNSGGGGCVSSFSSSTFC
jgi:hypothetical protein